MIQQSGARKNLRDLNSVIKESEELIALEEFIRSGSGRARNRTESEWARLIRAGSDLKSRLMYNDRLAQLVCLDPLKKRQMLWIVYVGKWKTHWIVRDQTQHLNHNIHNEREISLKQKSKARTRVFI